jgi:hypothetical protein
MRLEQFRVAHPDVPVLLLGACPRAWVVDQKIEHPTLRGLLDDLRHGRICGADEEAACDLALTTLAEPGAILATFTMFRHRLRVGSGDGVRS